MTATDCAALPASEPEYSLGVPVVSVLVLTMDRPQYVERAIESVRSQTFQNWELLIVQDGNNESVTRAIEACKQGDRRIRHFIRDRRGNIADANNFGLVRARGEYIAILDDDDFWCDPHKLAIQVRFLNEHPGIVGCGGGAICINQKGEETFRYLKPESDEDIKRHALKANPMVHSTLMYRREVAHKLGYYDASLQGFQDWDLVLKLGQSGKLYNFPKYFLNYQMWDGSSSFGAQRQNTRSALRIVHRHRERYNDFGVAIGLAYLYYLYARIPAPIKKYTFGPLSRMKKALFSAKPAPDAAGSRKTAVIKNAPSYESESAG
jgi:glycosyltransferase involved in cell wall biosynthesis